MEGVSNLEVDVEFYRNNHPDLHHLTDEQLVHHYIEYGKSEGRLPNNLDVDFYRKNHQDLQHMTDEQLVNHYIEYGKSEGRLPNNLDVDFYRKNHQDLQHMTDDQLLHHYFEYGKSEGRLPKKQVDDVIIRRVKICIIYVYSEEKNEQQNQTNLNFFLKYGLDKSRWRDVDITTLFIINGSQCEVLLPTANNIHVFNRDNSSNYDGIKYFEHKYKNPWYDGIKYFENKYNTPIYSTFTHLCLINSRSFGPVYEDGLDRHWTDALEYSNITTFNTLYDYTNQINTSCGDNIFTMYQPDYVKTKLYYKDLLPSITDNTLFVGNNSKCLIYAHYDADNIIKHYVIETLIIYAKLGYDIMFYTSSKTINNYDETYLPFKINYYPNKECGGGTDWYIWVDGCIKLQSQNVVYTWIALLNDSMIIGINGIDNMANTISEMENSNVDFWGHCDSSEISYHIMSSMYNFKYPILDYFIDFATTNLNKSITKADIVINCETKWTMFLQQHGFTTGAVIDTNAYPFQPPKIFRYDINNVINVPSHNPMNISSWINNERAFGVKWKYILPYLKEVNLNNEIKERLKYIHIGKYIGYQVHFPHIPIDLYRDNNLFGHEADIFKLVTFKQPYEINGNTFQFL